MDWLVRYLLIGFVLAWVGYQVANRKEPAVEWYWDLTFTVLWPLTIVIIVAKTILNKKREATK